MCGRFASFLPPEALRAIFRTVNPLPNAGPTWNLAPAQDALVVRQHPETGERHLDLLRWGFIPPSTRDLTTLPMPINARAESVARNAMFRKSFVGRRCLVPAGAFYEWRAVRANRQPYAIARADGAPLALAGIWSRWNAPSGEVIRSFAVLTTAANAAMRQLHNRMPVIIEEPDWPAWLGEGRGDPFALLRPAPKGVLRFWPVSQAVNSVRTNGPDLLDRIDDPQAPPPSDEPAGPNPA